MVGICSQWAIDEGLKPNELSIYLTIVRNSFGYKKRYCYVKYDSFEVSNRNSINKSITKMVSLGYLSVKNTHNPATGKRGTNEYRILEPREYIKNFVFNSKEEVKETKPTKEERWDYE